jgi:hypothetical protein
MRNILWAFVLLLVSPTAFAQSYDPDYGMEDHLIDYYEFSAIPTVRIPSKNTTMGYGGELGVSGSFRKGDPPLGIFLGYYAASDRTKYSPSNQLLQYQFLPITLRTSYDVPISKNGLSLAGSVEGGYSINQFRGNKNISNMDIEDTFIWGLAVGLKIAPSEGRFSCQLMGGYQGIQPKLTINGSGAFRNLGSPVISLVLVF